MRRPLLSLLIALTLLLANGSPSFAQDDVPTAYDARLEGYESSVTLKGGSSALYYILFIGLLILCVGVMFKNSKRSHLD